MVKFILGRASSGKTYTIMQKIVECLKNGENPVLLVPEQFSFESEKNILDAVGDGDAQKVAVISFTRLCDEVERENGGVCSESITNSDRAILMNRAIKNCRDGLVRFKKYANSSSFARLMIDSINEFKLDFVSVEDLRKVAEKIDDEQFKAKLLDTALIYENYDAVLSEKFIDNNDRLTKLYYALEKYNYFENKTVFIDSFKSFSGQQYKILERIVEQAKDVTIALTDNPSDKSSVGLFANVKKVQQRVLKTSGLEHADSEIILDKKNYNSSELADLEDFMATGRTSFSGESKDITVCCADSIYSEADFVARNMRRIVRESGGAVRYSDFVIIARDTAPYEDALITACKKNDVSCFIDKRIPLINLPTATAVLSAANAAVNFKTENILRFHKSGVNILTVNELARLENYIYIWNIGDGSEWQKEWTMNPKGMTDKPLTASQKDELEKINQLRQKAIMPLENLRKQFYGTAQNMARALVRLLDDTNAADQFKKLSKKYDDSNYADAVKQSWDSVMKILNSLCHCFGDSTISKPAEFCDALRMALSLETVGVIPQMIDEAVFGAADRIRPSRPKYAFIMGANNGIFPRIQLNEGLFASNERQILTQYLENLEKSDEEKPNKVILDKTISSMIDEEHLLYSNVCCASNGLFISYSKIIDGTEAQPSAFVEDIKSKFKCKCFNEPSELKEGNLPETLEDAFSLYCSEWGENEFDKEIFESLFKGSEYEGKAENVSEIRSKATYTISSDTAKKLYGDAINMSASRLTAFGQCRFKEFCRHGLGISALEPVEYSTAQRGSFIHYILQKAVEKHGKGLSALDESQISALVDDLAEEYLGSIAGYSDIETIYFKFLSSNVKRAAKYVIGRLAAEFAQSDFEPVACELRIGDKKDKSGNVIKKGDIPAVQIPIDSEHTIVLNGEIDRVDVLQTSNDEGKIENYVRIVDYKSSKKDFNLSDVLYAQNMQMLVYLYALLKSKKYGDKSAGILYMTAKRFVKKSNPGDRRMNGLLIDDEKIVTAMEKDKKGEYAPKYDNKGNFITDDEFEKIFEFVENKLKSVGEVLYSGDIEVSPTDGCAEKSNSSDDDESGACQYCDFQNICRIGGAVHKKVPKLTNKEVLDEMERQVGSSGV